MRYQQQQKGLFTFYKEQQLFQLKIERLKQQKIQQEIEKHQPETHKKQPLYSHNNSIKVSPQKFKVASQPTFNAEDAEQIKARGSKLKQIGNSVVIINRKNTEANDFITSAREISQQDNSKQTGHFIENKKIEFQQLQKFKISHPLINPKKRKKSYFKRGESYSQSKNDEERISTKLPTLVKVEQNDYQDEIQHHSSLKTKPVVSSLRSQGGNLMKYIRSNMNSECQTNQQLGRQSVSFIEYSKGYLKNTKTKQLDGLNEGQKRLLQILGRYRNQNN